MKFSKLSLIIIISIIIMIASVFFFNYVIKKDKEKKQKAEDTPVVDLSNASNVSTIDAKLGDDLVITQGYLMRYVTKKRSIWYQSEGYVLNVTNKNGTASINVGESKNSKNYITLYIDSDKCSVKKNDYVYFVGTINVGELSINLSKISNQEFTYSSATKMKFSDLLNNMTLIKNNVFIIQGFLVTDNDTYKIYDTKDDYKNNGSFFIVKWNGKFNYTGNQIVYISCNLDKGYSLKNCIYND